MDEQVKITTKWDERSLELCEELREAAVAESFARVTVRRAMSILSEAEDKYEKHLAGKPEETDDVQAEE